MNFANEFEDVMIEKKKTRACMNYAKYKIKNEIDSGIHEILIIMKFYG